MARLNRLSSGEWLTLASVGIAILLWLCQYVLQLPSDRQLLFRSLLLASGTAIGSVALGQILASALSASHAWVQKLAIAALAGLVFVPLYILFCAWDAAGGKLGWLTLLVGSPAQPLLSGLGGAMFIHIMASLPLVTLWLRMAQRTHSLAYQAATLEGPAWIVFWRLQLPQMLPLLLALTLWIFLQTLGEMTITNIYLVKTYIEEVYNSLAGNIDPREALTGRLSLSLWIGTTLFLLIALLPSLLRGIFTSDQRGVQKREPRAPLLTATAFTLLAILLLLGLPIVSFSLKIGDEVQQSSSGVIHHWSAGKALTILSKTPAYFSREIRTSTLVAIFATSGGLLLAMLASWPWLRPRHRPPHLLRMLPLIGLIALAVLPGPVVGLWLTELFGNSSSKLLNWLYDRTIFVTAIAQGMKSVPVQALIMAILFWRIPKASLESAELEAGPLWSKQLRLLLSECGSGIAATWLVGFLLASGDMAFSQLVVPPGLETLPRRIFGLAHSGIDEQLAAMGLWILLVTFLLLAILQKLGKRSARASFSTSSKS